MKLYYKSIENEANEWLANEITIKGINNLKPKLHLQACGRKFFKLCYEHKTLFWAKQHCCHYGVALLKTFEYESILSPICSREVEKRKGLSQSEALESWGAYFINNLEKKENEFLYDGKWLMTAYVHIHKSDSYAQLHKHDMGHACIHGGEDSLAETTFQQIDWFIGNEVNLVNLKRVNEYDGRLKWWQKKARENALPPIFLLYVSGLDNYIILDGHYRLKAAYDEGIKVDILMLRPIEKSVYSWDNEKEKNSILKNIEQNSFGIEQTNNLLLKAYKNQDTFYGSRSRVFGTCTKGMKEVISYLHKLDRIDLMQSFFDGEWDEE
jgi:hypothetical protein